MNKTINYALLVAAVAIGGYYLYASQDGSIMKKEAVVEKDSTTATSTSNSTTTQMDATCKKCAETSIGIRIQKKTSSIKVPKNLRTIRYFETAPAQRVFLIIK